MITKADIQEYLELDERRKALDREAKALHAKQKAIGDRLQAFVKKSKKEAVTRCGYVLAIVKKQIGVKWKKEFVRVAGLKEAARIAAAQPEQETLQVMKAG